MGRQLAEAFHPGKYIPDELEERDWTTAYLAERMLVSEKFVKGLIAGTERVNIQAAERLENAFGTSAVTWLHLQKAYDRGRRT